MIDPRRTHEYSRNWDITGIMINLGGSFVKQLGILWRLGDSNNQERLQTAFPEYWERYKELLEGGD